MDSFLEIELDSWGFTFSTAPYYFSISWGGLIVIGLAIVALRIRKVRKNKYKF